LFILSVPGRVGVSRRLGADEGHAFQPELQGLPVDAQHDAGGEQGHAQEGAEQCASPTRLAGAGDGGQQQFALGIVVIDADHRAVALQMEAEAVAALDIAEGRDVEFLAGAQFHAIRQRPPAVVQQVAVTAAEGVADLGEHGDQWPSRSWQNQKLTGLKT
jgi:hypothetical protein